MAPTRGSGGQNTVICMKLSNQASSSFLCVCSLERNAGKVYSILFTLLYYIYIIYSNKEEEEGKKKINGLDRSVRWSEELSFRANDFVILF